MFDKSIPTFPIFLNLRIPSTILYQGIYDISVLSKIGHWVQVLVTQVNSQNLPSCSSWPIEFWLSGNCILLKIVGQFKIILFPPWFNPFRIHAHAYSTDFCWYNVSILLYGCVTLSSQVWVYILPGWDLTLLTHLKKTNGGWGEHKNKLFLFAH